MNLPNISEIRRGYDEVGPLLQHRSKEFIRKVLFEARHLSTKSRESSIVQLLAACEDQKFNKYVTPSQEVSEEASRVIWIKFDATTNELLHNNVAVSYNHPLQVLLDFIQFDMLLGENCELVAHNNKCFDSVVLLAHNNKCFDSVVSTI